MVRLPPAQRAGFPVSNPYLINNTTSTLYYPLTHDHIMHLGLREGQFLAMVVLPTLMVKYKADQTALTRVSSSIQSSSSGVNFKTRRDFCPETTWTGEELV